jgi:UDP-N-acetylglucosamine 3-dehydrogenase
MTGRVPSIGVLFLGCGAAAGMHSRTLRRIGHVQLFYASRDPARATRYQRHFGGPAAFDTYDAGLEDSRVDVAFVATPTVTHRDLALRSLAAGKDVIVENPAFMHAADVDLIRHSATRADRRVFVAENYVYKPITTLIRHHVEDGELGDVRFVLLNATRHQPADGWRNDPALSGGGALFEAGIHWISFASSIGLAVTGVSAQRVGSAEGPDRSSLVVFRYANGAVGALAHSWELRAPLRGLRLSKVQGLRGAITFESNGLAAFSTGRHRRLHLTGLRDLLGYRAMLTDVLQAIRSGEPPRYTLDDARRDLELAERAQRSMDRDAGAEPR